MTKLEFLDALKEKLQKRNLPDAVDIVEEYEQHFRCKLADGYSEEEIAAKLGTPSEIAAQYDAPQPGSKDGKKVISIVGLGVTDIFFGIFCILLVAWEVAMGAFTLSCAVVTVGLFTDLRVLTFAYIPVMPYPCAMLFGIVFAALTVLSTVGTFCFYRFIRQFIRSFGRFHKNTLAAASDRPVLPPVAPWLRFPAREGRRLRTLTLIAAVVLAVSFVIGYIVCVFSAGALEFWHVWGWFISVSYTHLTLPTKA